MADQTSNELPPIFVHSDVADLGLSPAQFRVYGQVARIGLCYAKLSTIAEDCRLHRDTVIAALKSLVEMGLLCKDTRPGRTAQYRVSLISTWKVRPVGKQVAPIQTGQADNTYHKGRGTPGGKQGAGVTETKGHKGNPSEGNPIKGERPPLAETGANQLTDSRRISAEKALERAEAELARLKSQVEGGYPLDAEQKLRRAELRENSTEIKASLGWKA